MHRVSAMLFVLVAASSCRGQFSLQTTNTKANFRGIDAVDGDVAWVSGTDGTILRTQNGGRSWQACTIPPGAEHLDFRGVQAVDRATALAMSSGAGPLSRVYKTTDGCSSWKLLFANPDQDGFWDAIRYDRSSKRTFILGDPVAGKFVLFVNSGTDRHWSRDEEGSLKSTLGQAAFAASNSLLSIIGGQLSFVTGGSRSELIHLRSETDATQSRSPLPFAPGESSGAFSMAQASYAGVHYVVVVGGDYKHPDERRGTAAFSTDGGYTFSTSETPPGGYRSAVAYDSRHHIWIAVGPNGTDISRDGGRNWSRLPPQSGDAAGAGTDWNALSLPFVVGPHGRIGKLRGDHLLLPN